MISGLDLFSGIGGLTLALREWVRPVAYCEIDPYPRGVLLSRMSDGQLPVAPIWDNVQTLRGSILPRIDIIYGGFPCQDISVAGNGKGLEGERSGLFFEICRLIDECRPTFVFLENVPAIRTRGLKDVCSELSSRGYDCRWTMLSAAEVGANHRRNRWWLLAYAERNYLRIQSRGSSGESGQEKIQFRSYGKNELMADSNSKKCTGLPSRTAKEVAEFGGFSWWQSEPNVGRVVAKLPFRVDRIKALGNAVVPLQAKEAFRELIGVG